MPEVVGAHRSLVIGRGDVITIREAETGAYIRVEHTGDQLGVTVAQPEPWRNEGGEYRHHPNVNLSVLRDRLRRHKEQQMQDTETS